jgi:6-pyruvoyltetrahydropterin/6-carboxytetrahydropterin synthase
MLYLTKRVHFSASHQLRSPDLSPEENREVYGPCYNNHGHNYTLEVTVRGKPDPGKGWFLDLGKLKRTLMETIVDEVDHKNLNEDVSWLDGVNPTAENLAVCFWRRLQSHVEEGELHRVRVYESDSNFADYLGEES